MPVRKTSKALAAAAFLGTIAGTSAFCEEAMPAGKPGSPGAQNYLPSPPELYWNGGAAPNFANRNLIGGDGTWDNITDNWVNHSATDTWVWPGDFTTAIFPPQAGTVTVDSVIEVRNIQLQAGYNFVDNNDASGSLSLPRLLDSTISSPNALSSFDVVIRDQQRQGQSTPVMKINGTVAFIDIIEYKRPTVITAGSSLHIGDDRGRVGRLFGDINFQSSAGDAGGNLSFYLSYGLDNDYVIENRIGNSGYSENASIDFFCPRDRKAIDFASTSAAFFSGTTTIHGCLLGMRQSLGGSVIATPGSWITGNAALGSPGRAVTVTGGTIRPGGRFTAGTLPLTFSGNLELHEDGDDNRSGFEFYLDEEGGGEFIGVDVVGRLEVADMIYFDIHGGVANRTYTLVEFGTYSGPDPSTFALYGAPYSPDEEEYEYRLRRVGNRIELYSVEVE